MPQVSIVGVCIESRTKRRPFRTHFSFHPRSSLRKPGSMQWLRRPQDQGSVPIHAHVHVPEALLRPDGQRRPMSVQTRRIEYRP